MFAFIHRLHHFPGRAMDPSCECVCDCEKWASRLAYDLVKDDVYNDEHVIERLYCERCYTKQCRHYYPKPDPNPWKN